MLGLDRELREIPPQRCYAENRVKSTAEAPYQTETSKYFAAQRMDDEFLEKLAHPEYWDVRYTAEGEGQTYDWFKSYPVLAVFFTKQIPLSNPLPRILHLGCGSSTGALGSQQLAMWPLIDLVA